MFLGGRTRRENTQWRETVEHPFYTIKARMGAARFLMKTLNRVRTDKAQDVLAYNLTRGMKPWTTARPPKFTSAFDPKPAFGVSRLVPLRRAWQTENGPTHQFTAMQPEPLLGGDYKLH